MRGLLKKVNVERRIPYPPAARNKAPRTWIAVLAAVCLLGGMAASADEGYRKVDGPCGLTFPGDHGAHRQFKTEWWYYTGNLQSDAGKPFGFQLTFFRTALRPPTSQAEDRPRSAWRTAQLFIGHAAITDVDRQTHLHAETAAREALDMAGVRTVQQTTTVFVRKWHADIDPRRHLLLADAENFSLDLALTPTKPAVRHGRDGYSRKGTGPERASCYYSFTRLAAEGKIRIEDRALHVSGSAWMDHEFSTAPLEPGLVGWDWFSLQLSDRTELMVYLLREKDGTVHPASSGTFVDAAGRPIDLKGEQFSVQVLDRWQSPESGADYPVAWRLSVTALNLTLVVRARVRDQEMDTRQTTGVVYWEGSVSADRAVSGSGYVELTGYARPFDAPM